MVVEDLLGFVDVVVDHLEYSEGLHPTYHFLVNRGNWVLIELEVVNLALCPQEVDLSDEIEYGDSPSDRKEYG